MPVLLSEVFGAHEWIKELQGFDVRYVEQLGSLLATFRGRAALSLLEHPVPSEEVRDQIDAILRRNDGITFTYPRDFNRQRTLSLLSQQSHGLGYKLPPVLQNVEFRDVLPPFERLTASEQLTTLPTGINSSLSALSNTMVSSPLQSQGISPSATSSASPISFPSHAYMQRILTPVRDQHYRGTCVAFAVTALLESLLRVKRKQSLDLSEQYVYLVTRQNDPDRRESGSYLRYALDVLQQQGACRGKLLPYVRWDDWGQASLFQNPTRTQFTLDNDAYNYRINS